MLGKGEFKLIDIRRPLVLGIVPWTRKEIVVHSPGLTMAVAAFNQVPHDDRSDVDFQASWTSLKDAAAPYLGAWYCRGDPSKRCLVRLGPGIGGGLNFARANGHAEDTHLFHFRTDLSGRVIGLTLGGKPVSLSADGLRLDIEAFNEWWSREPTPQAKKSDLTESKQ
jgi:hypothetical protein